MEPNLKLLAEQFFRQIDTYISKQGRQYVVHAFDFARQAHGDVRRKSGELFICHPVEVAFYLAEFHLDQYALAAALLHDVVEDTEVTIEEIEHLFGKQVRNLVGSVTKMKHAAHGADLGQAESIKSLQDATLENLLITSADDERAAIIKLFDRLHNLRTIGAVKESTRQRTASETFSIYQPLANRLGIWRLVKELGELALKAVEPKNYHFIADRLKSLHKSKRPFHKQVVKEIKETLQDADIPLLEVRRARESIYRIYSDSVKDNISFDDAIDKSLRLALVFEDWMSCYQALGHLHRRWSPVHITFRDFIAHPRDNLYRSLHTTVVHKNGQRVSLRLRTRSMDIVSDIGVLARWRYANASIWSEEFSTQLKSFFKSIKENINVEAGSSNNRIEGIVKDVLGHQIRVRTPRGDVHELPDGATPVDFAYAIHTELGDQCRGAYVNGQSYQLNKAIKMGDRVRIEKGRGVGPLRAWLDEDLGYIKTHYARHHAERWFRRLSLETAVAQGRQLLETELIMLGTPNALHYEIAQLFNYDTIIELYHDLGRAILLPTMLATRLLEKEWPSVPMHALGDEVTAKTGEKHIILNANNHTLRLCSTCSPHPGDNISGYLRKDDCITVHKDDCRTLHTNNHSYIPTLKLEWGKASSRNGRWITLQIDVLDRAGLLFDMTRLLKNELINIPQIHTAKYTEKGHHRLIVTIEVQEPRQVVRFLHQVKVLANISSVQIMPNEILAEHAYKSALYLPE